MQNRAKTIFMALLLTVMVPAVAFSQGGPTTVPPGPVWGIWTAANSPYQVSGCITIEPTKTLQIERGVVVEFGPEGKLVVSGGQSPNSGTLKIGSGAASGCGAEPSRVAFTDQGGGWLGIVVESGAVLQDFKAVDFSNATDTALTLMSGQILMDLSFTSCSGRIGGAVYAASGLTVQNCVFDSNIAGLYGGAIAIDGGNLTVTDVSFTDNTAGYYGGAIDIVYGNMVLMTRGTLLRNPAPAGSAVSADG